MVDLIGVRRLAAAAACALAVAGCDNLPWSSKAEESVSAGLPTAQQAVIPPRPVELPQEIVAKVNGAAISRTDVSIRLEELKDLLASTGQEWTPLPVQASEGQPSLAGVLEELIQAELISQDAVARKDALQSLDTQRRWEYLRRGFLAQEWQRRYLPDLTVTAEDVKAFYDQFQPSIPERIQLRRITIATEADAKRVLTQLYSGTVEFAALAQQISIGLEAPNGGLIGGWIVRDADRELAEAVLKEPSTVLEPALEAAAFAVDRDGGLSADVKGPDNRIHIFQLVHREPARVRELTEVSDQITELLKQEKLAAAIGRLQESATIERFPDRLESVMQ